MVRSRRFIGILILLIAVVGSTVVWAQQAPAWRASSASATSAEALPGASAVRLLVGRSTIIDVGTPIARVSLTSPDIADALVTTPSQLLINGKVPGTISMFVWDKTGGIRRYEVIVQRDLVRLAEQLRRLFPGETIDVQSNGKDIVLSGIVSTKETGEKATDVAAGYVDKKDQVVSLLRVQEPERTNQVLLRVRFAEVSRNALTELGSSIFTGANGYKNLLGRATTQEYDAPVFDNKGANGNELVFNDYLNLFLFDMKHQLGTVIKALQSKGLFQSLAEPNLVAESGKEASFLAGGEIPVPVAQGSGNGVTVTVQYKEFGIRLNFTPTVNGNRIHLKVRPEVSSLDFANGVVLQGFRIPALTTRRAETQLELEDGQTFAIAGLMNNTVSSTMQKIPGIGDIPILGLLFRSKQAQKDRTELVVMITPQILPRNSPGVTSTLPKHPETYLPPLPPKKSLDQPPPAFSEPTSTMKAAAPAATPAASSPAAAAAAAVSALTPGAPQIAQPASDPPPADAAAPENAGVQPAATDASSARQLTEEEQTAQAVAEARAKAARDREAAHQAKLDRKNAEKEKKRQEKLAREQAKRDAAAARQKAKADAEAAKEAAKKEAEAQKKQEEAAKKQAEEDKKQAEAAAKKQAEAEKNQAREAEGLRRAAEVRATLEAAHAGAAPVALPAAAALNPVAQQLLDAQAAYRAATNSVKKL